ncbi:MAG TPA: energy transducer TonB [Terriglobales bacterium]|nr:energy transducer TonB [Terriglobales bacterium]
MFADSLLESSPHLGHRSAWTKLASVLLQSLALAVALVTPLYHIERLQVIPPPPSIRLTSAQPAAIRTETPHLSHSDSTTYYDIVQPPFIPSGISRTRDRDEGPPGVPNLGPACVMNCGGGVPITELVKPGAFDIPKPPPPRGPVRVSEMQLGELVRKVLPEYPTIAKQIRLQGQVVLVAIVGKDGRVERVQPVSGPPLLIAPAQRAVEQWQYRPYLLNHQPVEVQTQITVNFVLNKE